MNQLLQIAILITSIVVITLGAAAYLALAARSLRVAAALWPVVEQSASHLMSEKYPLQVRRVAYQLGMSTGCGCYVTGFLLNHYLPAAMNIIVSRTGEDKIIDDAIAKLDHRQKNQVDKLIAATLLYDAASNPVRGALVLRVIKYRAAQAQMQKPDIPAPTREAKEAVLHTLVAKGKKFDEELCIA